MSVPYEDFIKSTQACSACGAWVVNMKAHTEFHLALATLAEAETRRIADEFIKKNLGTN